MRYILTIVLSTFLFASTSNAWKVDTEKSSIVWSGNKVVGKDMHTGLVKIKSGKVNYGKGGLPDFATVVVDMPSMTNTDLKGKWNAKLIKHLKSDDFFDVGKFPEAKIMIDMFSKKDKNTYALAGLMTIKGIQKRVKMTGVQEGKKITVNYEFDRTDWNVRYGSGKFFKGLGDKMISDKIALKVTLLPKE